MWDTDRPREEWVALYPAQVALATSQIVWTEETETALDDLENGTDDAAKTHLEASEGRRCVDGLRVRSAAARCRCRSAAACCCSGCGCNTAATRAASRCSRWTPCWTSGSSRGWIKNVSSDRLPPRSGWEVYDATHRIWLPAPDLQCRLKRAPSTRLRLDRRERLLQPQTVPQPLPRELRSLQPV